MKYNRLGNTGLKVSELCLGTMTFGSNFYNIGSLEQEDSTRMVARARDAGINFFDTADMYSFGQSEVILGQAIKDIGATRESVVIATKVRSPMSEAAWKGTGDYNNVGLSRKHIFEACEASLKRLGTDYIDLYQVHGWDKVTPVEESLRALDDLVHQGKVRYLGCSNWTARHLAKGLGLAALHDWNRFVSLQAYYSLVGRDLEHELLPLCIEEGLGVLPWSPLAGGFLSGKYRRESEPPPGSRRIEFDFPPIDRERGYDAVEALDQVSKQKDASVAQIALAWLLHQRGVASVIIGASKMSQLEDNLKAADLQLTEDELAHLSAPTAPAKLYPEWMLERQNEGR